MKISPHRLFEICKDLAISADRFVSKKVFKERTTGFERLTKAIEEADKQELKRRPK